MRRRPLGKALSVKRYQHIAMAAAGVVQGVGEIKTLQQGIESALHLLRHSAGQKYQRDSDAVDVHIALAQP